EFGLGTTSRLLDMGVGFAGFHVGVMGFLQYDVGFTLDSTLRSFLVSDSTALPNTNYFVNVDGTVQAGFAPTVSFASRVTRGAGVNDIGAELTWSHSKIQHFVYDNAGDSIASIVVSPDTSIKTKLPITYVGNAALHMGTGTTVGGDVVNSGRGTVIHVGVEQR